MDRDGPCRVGEQIAQRVTHGRRCGGLEAIVDLNPDPIVDVLTEVAFKVAERYGGDTAVADFVAGNVNQPAPAAR